MSIPPWLGPMRLTFGFPVIATICSICAMSCSPRTSDELSALTSVTNTFAPPSASASAMPPQESTTPNTDPNAPAPWASTIGYCVFVYVPQPVFGDVKATIPASRIRVTSGRTARIGVSFRSDRMPCPSRGARPGARKNASPIVMPLGHDRRRLDPSHRRRPYVRDAAQARGEVRRRVVGRRLLDRRHRRERCVRGGCPDPGEQARRIPLDRGRLPERRAPPEPEGGEGARVSERLELVLAERAPLRGLRDRRERPRRAEPLRRLLAETEHPAEAETDRAILDGA